MKPAFVTHTFGVNLCGVVDPPSHHPYGSPRAHVRELLQNAVDTTGARRTEQPDAPGHVLNEPPEVTGDGALHGTDTGTGLTEQEVHSLLSTVGNTSTREEPGFAVGTSSASSGRACCPASWRPSGSGWSPARPGRPGGAVDRGRHRHPPRRDR